MSVIRKMGWIPPLLELVGAVFTFLSLNIGESKHVSMLTNEGDMEKVATISVSYPVLGIVGLVLIGIGLLFQAYIEYKRK